MSNLEVGITATARKRTTEILGFRATTVIASLVGLGGGILFGIWDSTTVIINHAGPSVAIAEILLFSLYSISLYALIGCIGMVVMGTATAAIIHVGRYSISTSKLAGIFIGLFALVGISLLLALKISSGDILGIIKNLVLSIAVGLAAGSLSTYVLDKVIKKDKLIALCISLLVSIPVALYGCGLWIHLGLLHKETFWKPLLASVAPWLIVSLLAIGLYFLSLFILRKCNHHKTKLAGLIMLAILTCVFAAVSLTGPF